MAGRDERALIQIDAQQMKKNTLWNHVVLLEGRDWSKWTSVSFEDAGTGDEDEIMTVDEDVDWRSI